LIEGWQMSWILSLAAGRPNAIAGATTMVYGNAQYSWLNQSAFEPTSGHITWAPGAYNGFYFPQGKYVSVTDPQCADLSRVMGILATTCSGSLNSLAARTKDAAGNNVDTLIAINPSPGQRGSMKANLIPGPGTFSLDMALGKSIQLTEGKSFTLRIDASNILNHPTPSGYGAAYSNARFTTVTAPNFYLSPYFPFGVLQSKSGHRTFQAKLTLRF
jgi:hypothetical protein